MAQLFWLIYLWIGSALTAFLLVAAIAVEIYLRHLGMDVSLWNIMIEFARLENTSFAAKAGFIIFSVVTDVLVWPAMVAVAVPVVLKLKRMYKEES